MAVCVGDFSHTDTPTQCLPTGISPTMIPRAPPPTRLTPYLTVSALSLTPVFPQATFEGH